MNSTWKFARSALAVGLLLAAPMTAAAQEQRCNEIGSNCVCSEPLNTASYDTYQCDRLPCANPSDGNVKECSGAFSPGYAWYGSNLLEVVPTPGTAQKLPSGNRIDHVWRSISRGNEVHNLFHRDGVTPQTRRICTRHYFNTSADYNDGAPSCSNRKHIDLAIGGGRRVFFVRDTGPAYRLETPGYSANNGNNWGVGNLNQADCTASWCRVELCIDGDIQNLRGLTVDGYIQQVGGSGKRTDFPRKFIGNATGGGGYSFSWLLNMWREGPNCSGWRQFSHVMFAAWESASGQNIGPACEFEGVCDGSSGGPGGSPGPDPVQPPADGPLGPPGRPYLVN